MSPKLEKLKEVNDQLKEIITKLETRLFLENNRIDNKNIIDDKKSDNLIKSKPFVNINFVNFK